MVVDSKHAGIINTPTRPGDMIRISFLRKMNYLNGEVVPTDSEEGRTTLLAHFVEGGTDTPYIVSTPGWPKYEDSFAVVGFHRGEVVKVPLQYISKVSKVGPARRDSKGASAE